MKRKGGYVYGSIYERKRKDKDSISYVAEIHFQGQTMRRSLKDRKALSVWMNNVCEQLNSLLDEYNDKLAFEVMNIKNKLYANMIERAKPIMDSAKQYDLRNKVCANGIGLLPVDDFQTYLVKDYNNGLVKIGKSKDIHTRLQVLGNKDKQLIAYVRKDIETVLHREYKGKRIKGEWFNLTDTEINKIISTYSFERPGVLFI